MSKKFPQLTPNWVKKNIPEVKETTALLKFLKKAITDLEDVLRKLDDDDAPSLTDLNIITKVHADLAKDHKDLLTQPWKDSKTKGIPTALKELDTALKLLKNITVSAMRDAESNSKVIGASVLNINISINKLNKKLEDASKACKAIDDAIKSATPVIANVKSTAAQKKQKAIDLKKVIDKLSPQAFGMKEWTAIWRDAKSQYDNAKFADKSQDQKVAAKVVDGGSTALAKQLEASESLQKNCTLLLTKLAPLIKAK